jgi:hypothetical protein
MAVRYRDDQIASVLNRRGYSTGEFNSALWNVFHRLTSLAATVNGRVSVSENSANDMCQPKNGTRIQDGTSIKVSFVIRTGARRQAARRIVIVGPCRVRSGTESVDPIATPDPRINRFHDDMPYHSRVTLKARLTLRRCTLRGETAKARYETDQDEAFPGHLAILAGSMTFPRQSHEYHMTRP